MNMLTSTVKEEVRKHFDFHVSKRALIAFDFMPVHLRTPWYGLFRDDTNEPVGKRSVSSRYEPHQVDDVLALVEAAAEGFGAEVNCQCSWRDGQYVGVKPIDSERLKVFGKKDSVFPHAVVRAPYDGRAFQFDLWYDRDLCRNMAMLRHVKGATMRLTHNTRLRERMDEMIARFRNLRKSWSEISAVIMKMEERTVNLSDFLSAAFAADGRTESESERTRKFAERRVFTILNRLGLERIDSGRVANGMDQPERDSKEWDDYSLLGAMEVKRPNFTCTAWEAFNAVQGYAQHGTRRQGKLSYFDRALRASDDQFVRVAEELALTA